MNQELIHYTPDYLNKLPFVNNDGGSKVVYPVLWRDTLCAAKIMKDFNSLDKPQNNGRLALNEFSLLSNLKHTRLKKYVPDALRLISFNRKSPSGLLVSWMNGQELSKIGMLPNKLKISPQLFDELRAALLHLPTHLRLTVDSFDQYNVHFDEQNQLLWLAEVERHRYKNNNNWFTAVNNTMDRLVNEYGSK